MDAVFEATIQVLLVFGPRRLTTTRVAERAGVSVGTLYQYFPNKQALFYALNERYLEALAERIECACLAQHGGPIETMIQALVDTYWKAKTERADVTRALYQSVAEIDNGPLIEAFGRRVDAATTAMFASSKTVVENLATVNLTLVTTIFGTVRSVFERNLRPAEGEAVRQELISMCVAYTAALGTPPAGTIVETSLASQERG
ncbi:TetR/AcrR family transcriptional regulator [Trinickia sp. NRRL B-1857]|uniref:TetR family transcriptional regulator n=1 Tax=Trinickia sp. NRRL B-1857 TaxID=3162879 RepID=UPI003D29D560